MESTREAHDEALFLTVRQTGQRLGISRATLYLLFKSGDLPSVKIRGSRMVAVEDFAAYVARVRSGAAA